ncbi:MAG: helix-turn-helix transcriptional regulator, partial [Clostridia bacterium]|nr:helix-turn-helix transcriptional regulator [Clostridia bacterium]
AESSLYPIMRRLEDAGMLTVRLEEHNCRLRKYYRITEGGLKKLEEFHNDWKELLAVYEFVTRKEKKDDEA